MLCFLPGLDVSHLATVTDPLGNTTTRTYDAVSRLMTQTDPLGRLTWYTYDLLNRLSTLVDPLQGLTRFTYDANGNLLTVQDALGQTTRHTDDPPNRRVEEPGSAVPGSRATFALHSQREATTLGPSGGVQKTARAPGPGSRGRQEERHVLDRITFDPQRMGGRACLRGLRIPVSLVVNLVANGMAPAEILHEYPDLEAEDIRQALQYAASLANEELQPFEPSAR